MKLLTNENAQYDHTLAAKNIRIELKHNYPGHKFSVRSKSFSMGDSVDVHWIDGPTVKEIESLIRKYERGSFNGMEDIYEYNMTDFNTKHGSTKYASGSRELSYNAEIEILKAVSEKWGVDMDAMEITQEPSYDGKYTKAKYNYNLRVENADEWLSNLVHREGYGMSFYKKAQAPKPNAQAVEGLTITENKEKNGIEIKFPCKPSHEVLDSLKDHGFRWHRKLQFWYARHTDTRLEFANSLANLKIESPAPKPNTPKTPLIDPRIDKFNTMADNLDKQIEAKRAPMTQNPTPKRMRQYNSRLKDADDLENTQKALRAIAAAIESNTLPEILQDIRTKGDIEPLVRTGYSSNGYYDYHGTGKYVDDSQKAVALQNLIDSNTTEEQREQQAELEKRKEIEQLEEKVRFSQIDGFFPTPKPIIEKMTQYAKINNGDCVYDPEAGKGDIADYVKSNFDDVDIFVGEINYTLQEILKAKGYDPISTDFLEYNNGRRFDKIIMNPPFEKGQDIEHIQHAYKFLKDDGCLVSVISEGPFFRNDKKSTAFREWLDEVGGYTEQLDPKSFTGKDAFRQTGISTRLVIIEN